MAFTHTERARIVAKQIDTDSVTIAQKVDASNYEKDLQCKTVSLTGIVNSSRLEICHIMGAMADHKSVTKKSRGCDFYLSTILA